MKTSKKFITKFLNNSMTDVTDRVWYKTIYQYMIDSSERIKKKLSKYLEGQVTDYEPELLMVAMHLRCQSRGYNQLMLKVERYVYQRTTYQSNYAQFGKIEYWANAYETWLSRLGDCFPLEQKIIVKCKKTQNVEVRSFAFLKKEWKNYLALSYNFDKKITEFKPIINFVHKGKRMLYNVKLRSGKFRCTKDHKLYNQTSRPNNFKWNKLSDITLNKNKEGYLRAIGKINGFEEGTKQVSEELCNVISSYVADGWTEKDGRVRISGDNEDRQLILCSHLDKLGFKYSMSKRKVHSYITILKTGTPQFLLDIFKELGTVALNKKFPDYIMRCDNKTLNLFLKYYGDRDGTTMSNGIRFNYSTISNKLSDQLKLILTRLGISFYSRVQIIERDDCHRHPINVIVIANWKKQQYFERKQISNQLIKNYVQDYKEDVIEDVYDITVEGNHNFVLDNATLVHNCNSQAVLVYVLARLGGIPKEILWSAIGEVNVKGKSIGHYWNIYFNPKRGKLGTWFSIDTTYYPDLRPFNVREPFILETYQNKGTNTTTDIKRKYEKIWFIFNEQHTFKYKQ